MNRGGNQVATTREAPCASGFLNRVGTFNSCRTHPDPRRYALARMVAWVKCASNAQMQ
jgi:hypothetical protein